MSNTERLDEKIRECQRIYFCNYPSECEDCKYYDCGCKVDVKQIKRAILEEIKKIDMSESSHPRCWYQVDIRRILGGDK